MATWQQLKHPVTMFHPTKWTVVIDPPGEFRALMTFTTKALADVYMRNLKDNNPRVFPHAFILKPSRHFNRA